MKRTRQGCAFFGISAARFGGGTFAGAVVRKKTAKKRLVCRLLIPLFQEE